MATSLNPDARSFEFNCNEFGTFRDVSDVNAARRTLIVRELPHNIPKEEIEQVFQSESAPRLLRAWYAGNEKWYFEFENERAAIHAIWYLVFEVKYIYGSRIKAGLKSSVPQSYQNFRSSLVFPRFPQRLAYNSAPYISGQPLIGGHGMSLYPAPVGQYPNFSGPAYTSTSFYSGQGINVPASRPEYAMSDSYGTELISHSEVDMTSDIPNLNLGESAQETNAEVPENRNGIVPSKAEHSASVSGAQPDASPTEEKEITESKETFTLNCVPHTPLPQRNTFPRPMNITLSPDLRLSQQEDKDSKAADASQPGANASNLAHTEVENVAAPATVALPSHQHALMDPSVTSSKSHNDNIRSLKSTNHIAATNAVASVKGTSEHIPDNDANAVQNGPTIVKDIRQSSSERDRMRDEIKSRIEHKLTSYAEVLAYSLSLNDVPSLPTNRSLSITKPTTRPIISNVDKENMKETRRIQSSSFRGEKRNLSNRLDNEGRRYGYRFQPERSNSFGSRPPMEPRGRRDFNDFRRRDNDDFMRSPNKAYPRDNFDSRGDFRSNENRRGFNFGYNRRRREDNFPRRNPFLNDIRNKPMRSRTPVTDL